MNFKALLIRIRRNQLIKDSLWSLSGNAIGRGLALLAGIFIARFLGKDIFGEYSLIKSTILTIGVFSTFGLGFTSTKFVADYKREAPEYINLFIRHATRITLVFSGVMAVTLFLFANYVATTIFEAESLTIPLRYLAILIVFNAITTTQIGILAGLGEFKTLAKINGLVGILTFIFSVTFTYFWDFKGALFALLLVQILNCIFNFVAVRTEIPRTNEPQNINDPHLRRKIIKFSTPIALQAAVYNITSWIGSILLVRFANFGELGMYNAAMQWNAIILFIPGIMRNVVLSHLSSASNSIDHHKKVLQRTIHINFIATVIPCVVVAIFSPWIETLYGKTYQGLSTIINFALLSTIFVSINNVYAQVFTSLGKNWLMLIIRTIRDILTIVTFIILVTLLSYSGIYSMIVSTIFYSIAFLIVAKFLVNINYAKNI